MASEACCAGGQPVSADYTPAGSREKIGDMDVYMVGEGLPVVLIYDIFGFNFNQLFQVADRIAAAGFMVGMPDLFLGDPWTKDRFPPKPEHNFMGWMKGVSDVSGKVKPAVDSVLEVLKLRGAKEGKAGVLGFCWGGGMGLALASDPRFGAVGVAHPSFKMLEGNGEAAAKASTCPMALLPAGGDDVAAVEAVLKTKPYAAKCIFNPFPGQVHGFMAARGEWSDIAVATAATEGIELFSKFLKDNLC